MAPNTTKELVQHPIVSPAGSENLQVKKPVHLPIVWKNVVLFGVLHLMWIYAIYLSYFKSKWGSFFFGHIYGWLAAFGITAGSHRLWAHKTYKAKLPLRILLMILSSVSGQNDIYTWCRDHRVHHKFTETDADPHNSKRGFFFAHMGWLMIKKHPDVTEKGKTVDLSDLLEDPVVRFNIKYYYYIFFLFGYVVPTAIFYYIFEEPFVYTIFYNIHRLFYSLHRTWLVNSVAHMWGNKPYDIYLEARENLFVSLYAMGEGFHNYHHTFPWDYSTSEYRFDVNFTTMFIDFFALFGLAYDRKKVSPDVIRRRKERTGCFRSGETDSHELYGEEPLPEEYLDHYHSS